MKKITNEEFNYRVKLIYGDLYDCTQTSYVDSKEKVTIFCKKHGYFSQCASKVLEGHGCQRCGYEKVQKKRSKSTEQFIIDAKKIHGERYDYSKVDYVNNKSKVCIICPEHGEFWQAPGEHLKGHKCNKCAIKYKKNPVFIKKKGLKYSTEEFIEMAQKKHNDTYDYSDTIYNGMQKKVLIKCKKHGYFEQVACDHLKGRGCPICSSSSLENELRMLLKENKISFVEQQKFEWLKNKRKLTLDFYLPDYNIAIECQGEQHFNKINFCGKDNEEENIKKYNRTIENDKLKYELCNQNGVTIFYITNEKYRKYTNILFYKENKNLFFNTNDLLKCLL